MALCHPDVEWTAREDGVTYRGRDGVREELERFLESFEDYRYEVQRIVDCGGDDVLVVGLRSRQRGGKRGRGPLGELRTAHASRNGLILRFREFYDEHEALEAAGLVGVGDVAGERRDGSTRRSER